MNHYEMAKARKIKQGMPRNLRNLAKNNKRIQRNAEILKKYALENETH